VPKSKKVAEKVLEQSKIMVIVLPSAEAVSYYRNSKEEEDGQCFGSYFRIYEDAASFFC
jgi:hypothetical protein